MMYLILGLAVFALAPFVMTGLAILITLLACDFMEAVSKNSVNDEPL